ncbi:MAG: hypothetical protein GXO93_02080 [FCB group bacterium]|nr:hypothetical protein [FCB group bacterium]
MKKTVIMLASLMLMGGAFNAKASETKVHGRMYGYWRMDVSGNANSENDFGISRAYVTVKSKLSDYTSVRITSDIKKVSGYEGYSIILKYGYFDWKPKFAHHDLKFRFGLQPTLYIDNMNKLWGRRYLEKTISDERKFLTSADLGAALMYRLGEKGKYGYMAANVWNGTSYSHTTENNKYKDFSGFVILKPLENNPDLKRSRIVAQYYYGTKNIALPDSLKASDYNRNLLSAGGMLGYRHTLDLGFDINWYRTGQGAHVNNITTTGFSFFGTLYFKQLVSEQSLMKTLNVFGRVDIYDPNTDMDNNAETVFFGGIECTPVKGFKAAINLRSTAFEDSSKDSKTYLYFNTLVKF